MSIASNATDNVEEAPQGTPAQGKSPIESVMDNVEEAPQGMSAQGKSPIDSVKSDDDEAVLSEDTTKSTHDLGENKSDNSLNEKPTTGGSSNDQTKKPVFFSKLLGPGVDPFDKKHKPKSSKRKSRSKTKQSTPKGRGLAGSPRSLSQKRSLSPNTRASDPKMSKQDVSIDSSNVSKVAGENGKVS